MGTLHTKGGKMSLLYPSFSWLILPLALFLWKNSTNIMQRVHLMILILLVIALSRPVQEKALQEANIKAKDIVIAVDVSYSMQATDISPTRYDFAKETISALLKENPSDNIMLIAFTTNPLLLSPPTTDHALINIALKSLNPNFIMTKGTSLKNLFTKLSQMGIRQKDLILMTDGGEEKNLDALRMQVLNANTALTILALGSAQGTTVTLQNGSLLKDKEGSLVISRINPLLEALASATNSTYLTASRTPEATAQKLTHTLQSRETQNVQKLQHHYTELYQFPLAFALLLFFMLHTRAIKYLLLLFSLLHIPLQASGWDNYHLSSAYKSYEKVT